MSEFQPISNKDLNLGYFWLTHRQKYRKIFIGFFVVLLAALYFFIIFGIIQFTGQTGWQTIAASVNTNFNWAQYHQERQPKPIQLSRGQAFPLGNNRYNLAAVIKNPNLDWQVPQLDYNFIVNGQPLETQTAYLNVGEEKFLLQFGYNNPAGIKTVDVKLNNNIKWQRLDDNVPQIAWEISNLKYQPASTQEINKKTVRLDPRLSWQAKNLSLYNLWNVNFQVAMYNRDQIIAVSLVKADNFDALETRNMEASWLQDLGQVTTYRVIPEINWLDKDNFRQVEIPVEEDSRFEL